MFLDIIKDISKLHAIACRLLFFTAVVFGTGRASAADYVFMYDNYIFGQTTAVSTDFIPNNCIYTGTSGSTFQNGNGYYILYNDGLAFSTSSGTNLTIDGNYIAYVYEGWFSDTYYYLNMRNPNNNNRYWRMSNTTNNRATAYTVTTSANINDFTVSGDATITTTGTNNSYTHTDAEYYDIYTFHDRTYLSF